MASNKMHHFDVGDIIQLTWGRKRDTMLVLAQNVSSNRYKFLRLDDGYYIDDTGISPRFWKKLA